MTIHIQFRPRNVMVRPNRLPFGVATITTQLNRTLLERPETSALNIPHNRVNVTPFRLYNINEYNTSNMQGKTAVFYMAS